MGPDNLFAGELVHELEADFRVDQGQADHGSAEVVEVMKRRDRLLSATKKNTEKKNSNVLNFPEFLKRLSSEIQFSDRRT